MAKTNNMVKKLEDTSANLIIKPSVLVFVDWYKPAFKAGGPIQSIHKLVQNLYPFFSFSIFCGSKDLGENSDLNVEKLDEWVAFENAQVYYSTCGLSKTSFKEAIKFVKPQSVYINGIFSMNYSIKPLFFAAKSGFKNIIIAPRGMLGEGALEFKKIKKKIFLIISNVLTYSSKNLNWHATDKNEFDRIRKLVWKKNKIHLISNFYPFLNSQLVSQKKEKKLNLLFVSRISRKKNLLFAINVINKINYDVNFVIIGPIEDKAYWERCKKTLERSPSIKYNYLGPIEQSEIAQHYQDADYLIFPTFHENFGHVIAESIANCTPVLISRNTPFRNLELKGFGFDLDLNEPDVWLKKLTALYQETNEQYQIRIIKLKLFLKKEMDNEKLVLEYKKVFNNENSRS